MNRICKEMTIGLRVVRILSLVRGETNFSLKKTPIYLLVLLLKMRNIELMIYILLELLRNLSKIKMIIYLIIFSHC